MHSALNFGIEHPELYHEWHKQSNSVVVLACKSEEELYTLLDKTRESRLSFSEFREPDVGYALTSICLAPGVKSKRLISQLPLAGKVKSIEHESKLQVKLKEKFCAVDQMLSCQQTTDQNMLEHGWSVRNHTLELLPQYIEQINWKPEHGNLNYVLDQYTIWHDMSKHSVKTTDPVTNKCHYFGHAKASAEAYRNMAVGSHTSLISALIETDMDLHTIRDVTAIESTLNEYRKYDLNGIPIRTFIAIKTLVAFAELDSNAELFGGKESDSYKIKFKRLTKTVSRLQDMLNSANI